MNLALALLLTYLFAPADVQGRSVAINNRPPSAGAEEPYVCGTRTIGGSLAYICVPSSGHTYL